MRTGPTLVGVALAYWLAAGCAAHGGARNAAAPGQGKAKEKPPVVIPGALPIGWATVSDLGQSGTTGGGATLGITASSQSALWDAVAGDEPRVVLVAVSTSGSLDVGSNKTIVGAPGVVLHGHLELNGSVNVIVRNLKIVGYNCADAAECKHGKDAVSITGAAHHIWFDHCDISDGSDGNFDINEGSDYITISWTKFWYSGRRPGEHQYSNLLGSADSAEDTDRGHLRITFHHDWWADNVSERMPRVRFGQVHVFNNLYTSAGNRYCIGLGVGASILVENNAFIGVKNPINSARFSDASSALVARGNLFATSEGTTTGKGSVAFTPPYPYQLEPASGVRVTVSRGAGLPGAGVEDDDDEAGPHPPPGI